MIAGTPHDATSFAVATVCFSGTVGGLELATLRRAAEMQSRGHRVIAVLPDSPGLIEQASRLGLRHAVIRTSLRYADPFAAARLHSILEREAVDVLLVARTRDLSTAILAAGNERAVVLYQQMQSGLDKRDWFHDRVFRRLDACVTITERARAELIRCTALSPDKITTVAYPIDAAHFDASVVDPAVARAMYDIDDDGFVVGIVGGFNPGKGQREFLEALKVAAERDDGLAARLYAIAVGIRDGDSSEYVQELIALRESLPFASRVGFHPFTNDTRYAYRAMDLFVLASHCETFGMVLQEAMAMGVPTIGTDCGGVPEIVRDGATGLLVPPRDVTELADAILYLYRDPTLRNRLAARARQYIIDRYDPAVQYDRFEAVLRGAIDRRQRRAFRGR